MAENNSDFRITTDTPYLALSGELWGVYREDIGDNPPHYNGATLCLCINSLKSSYLNVDVMFGGEDRVDVALVDGAVSVLDACRPRTWATQHLKHAQKQYSDGIMQKRHNSIALAMALCLFCIKTLKSMLRWCKMDITIVLIQYLMIHIGNLSQEAQASLRGGISNGYICTIFIWFKHFNLV